MSADATTLAVCERFHSIQGESTRAGLPCLFIRLSGCNLRCRWCDAGYSWSEPGAAHSVRELADWALAHPCPLVEITGGEPLMQEAVYALMDALLAGGKEVLLETNGSLPIDRVPAAVAVILDVKCPGSGMAGNFCEENVAILRRRRAAGDRDEIKFVLADEADFHWALARLREHRLQETAPVLFSPVQPDFPPARLAELMLAHNAPARLQLQLHSLLWPGKTRGV